MERSEQTLKLLVDYCLSKNITENHPEYTDLIRTYFKYMDENYYSKIINILDNTNFSKFYAASTFGTTSTITTDMLHHFYENYFNSTIPADIIELNNDNKRIYTRLSKLINNTKGCQSSFKYLFEYLGSSNVISNTVGEITLGNLTVDLQESKDYWDYDTATPTKYDNAFTYLYNVANDINDTDGSVNTASEALQELFEIIHPAGFAYILGLEFSTTLNYPSVEIAVPSHCIMYSTFDAFSFDGQFSYGGCLTTFGTYSYTIKLQEIDPYVTSAFVDSCTPRVVPCLATYTQNITATVGQWLQFSTFVGFQYNSRFQYDINSQNILNSRVSTYDSLFYDASMTADSVGGLYIRTAAGTLYTVDNSINQINIYTFVPPFNFTSGTLTATASIPASSSTITAITFNSVRTALYVLDSASPMIYQYGMGAAYDPTTLSHEFNLTISEDTNPFDMKFSDAGDLLFILGKQNNRLYRYDLSTTFSISTATLTASLSLDAYDTDSTGFTFNGGADAKKLYITGRQKKFVYQLELSSSYNIAAATISSQLYVGDKTEFPKTFEITNGNSNLYLIDGSFGTLYSYSLPQEYDIYNTALITGGTLSYDPHISYNYYSTLD